MSRRYFSLLIRHEPNLPWSLEYGSYDRMDVMEERASYRAAYSIPKNRTMVITTNPRQVCINAEVNNQNKRLVEAGIIKDFNPLPV